jgi:hypothetical protein
VDSDKSGFQAVLHEWARRQLEERTWHAGPFEIVDVQLHHQERIEWSEVTVEDAVTNVTIRFRHEGVRCAFPIWLTERPCPVDSWWSLDSEETVTLLNQLLSIAGEG